ncbi:MAG: hypothetical protein QOG19_444 [Mycobacterium sp.]|nr:hypothetical protein [Mycobacterium sp.]
MQPSLIPNDDGQVRAEDLSSWASRMPLSASASRNSEGLTNQPAVEPVRQVGTTRDEPRTFTKP